MSGFVTPECVIVGESVSSREDVLHCISQRACELGIASDADCVYEAFLEREAQGPTGMSNGFAIPHAVSHAVIKSGVIICKSPCALVWPSFDGEPITVAVALLVPADEASSTHMRLLSQTATLLLSESFRDLVRASDDPAQIADAVSAGFE